MTTNYSLFPNVWGEFEIKITTENILEMNEILQMNLAK